MEGRIDRGQVTRSPQRSTTPPPTVWGCGEPRSGLRRAPHLRGCADTGQCPPSGVGHRAVPGPTPEGALWILFPNKLSRSRARARALSLGPSTVTVSVEAVGRGDQSSSTRENLNGPVTVTVDRPVMVDYGLGLPRTKQGVYSHRYNREIQIQF